MYGLLMAAMAVTAFIELYPAPQSAYMHGRNTFAVETILPIVMHDGADAEDLTFLEPLYSALGYEPMLMPASHFSVGDSAIYIGTVPDNIAFQHRSLRRYAPDPETAPHECYYLTINRNGIFLAGADRDGMKRGIHTLAQIIRASRDADLRRRGDLAVPHVEIRDHPDMGVRAALLRGPVTSVSIHAFAALKCNMLIFESDDFYDLTGERLAQWRGIFDETRAVGITPVPVFEVLRVPDAVIERRPTAVEGRSRIERLTLRDDDWAAFSRRNLIVTPENSLRVSVNETPKRHRQDYALSEGGLEPPFSDPYVRPWMLRRVPGGAIPDGAVATVMYSYAPPQTNVLCPHAPETRTLAREALAKIIEGLEPRFIHGGFGEITRLNQDLRCRDQNKTHAETFAASIALFQDVVMDINENIRTMIWADALLPLSETSYGRRSSSLQDALPMLSDNMILIARFEAGQCRAGGYADAVLPWMARRDMPILAAAAVDAPAAAYRLVESVGAGVASRDMSSANGIVLLMAEPLAPATRAVLGKAWSAASQDLPWPDGLNDFFESALWQPEFAAVKEALIQFLERHVLSGRHPRELREAFDQFLRDRRDRLDRDNAEVRLAATLFEELTTYLELEYEYAQGNERDALRNLTRLVRRYGEVDSEVDDERVQRIADTIESQQLFAPAPILIGQPLAYYRPGSLPAGVNAYEAPAQIEYMDEKGVAQATLDFLADCGGIFRIDFETVEASRIAVTASDDGVTFRPVPVYRNIEETERRGRGLGRAAPLRRPLEVLSEGAMRGPVFPATPVHARYLRVRVESRGEQAVLREVRVFAAKGATRAVVPVFDGVAPALISWPDAERAAGFLCADGQRLAVAPTEIQLARNSDHLFIGVSAQEPMPHAMGASMKGRDAPLWEEESIEVRIRPGDQPARRFLVNPLETQHDGMAVAGNLDQWDAGWDAEWRAEAEETSTGWTATIMLPFAILGGTPERGDTWHINFIRHRNNVERETSWWAAAPDNAILHYGALIFE